VHLLDSIPGAVAKEALKGVCRQLDLRDISDIPYALERLRSVVEAVPRMERFIDQVGRGEERGNKGEGRGERNEECLLR
jgi:hypothetical protein